MLVAVDTQQGFRGDLHVASSTEICNWLQRIICPINLDLSLNPILYSIKEDNVYFIDRSWKDLFVVVHDVLLISSFVEMHQCGKNLSTTLSCSMFDNITQPDFPLWLERFLSTDKTY